MIYMFWPVWSPWPWPLTFDLEIYCENKGNVKLRSPVEDDRSRCNTDRMTVTKHGQNTPCQTNKHTNKLTN